MVVFISELLPVTVFPEGKYIERWILVSLFLIKLGLDLQVIPDSSRPFIAEPFLR